jgi:uncharacterized protein (UPF0212 family)
MFRFLNNCVGTLEADVVDLNRMIEDATDITRTTFLKRVDREDLHQLESDLGYERHAKRGLTMNADWHVSYHKSHWKGELCYFFRHSHIEYYFTKGKP